MKKAFLKATKVLSINLVIFTLIISLMELISYQIYQIRYANQDINPLSFTLKEEIQNANRPKTRIPYWTDNPGRHLGTYGSSFTVSENYSRANPLKSSDDQRNIIFFGGSYVFSHGVNDNETLPYFFEKLFGEDKIQTHNFGVNGYGPESMHQILKFNNTILPKSKRKDAIGLYFFIPDHVRRSNLKFSHMMFSHLNLNKYFLENGKLEGGELLYHQSPSQFFFYHLLKNSYTMRIALNYIARNNKTDNSDKNKKTNFTNEELKLTALIIKDSKERFLKLYPNGKFFALGYAIEDYITKEFAGHGVEMLNEGELIPVYEETPSSYLPDFHLTKKGNKEAATSLLKVLAPHIN